MANWRDQLLPASFRGVSFQVEGSTVPVGQKVQLHEYPKRDEAYAEQMGKRARVHKLTAFVIGADCFEQRDKLLKALETEGEGTLVHPQLGQLSVIAGECEMTHDRREGGMVRFELTFFPGQAQSNPTARANTSQQAAKASLGYWDSALSRYQSAMAKVDAARINAIGLQNKLTGVFGVISRQFSPLLGAYSSVGSLAQGLTNAPGGISSLFSSYFADLGLSASRGGSSVSRSATSAEAASFSTYSQGVATVSRQAEDASAIDTLPPSNGADTSAAAQALANLVQDAVLVQATATAAEIPVATPPLDAPSTASVDQQAIDPVSRPDVPVANEVVDLRDSLDEVFWTAALKADPDHYLTLNAARQQVVRHLTQVAASGQRLVDVTPPEPTPALVLAYRRFGDATREGEIVQRNKIRHPGFVPAEPLKIAQE